MKHKKMLIALAGGWLLAIVIPPQRLLMKFRGPKG